VLSDFVKNNDTPDSLLKVVNKYSKILYATG